MSESTEGAAANPLLSHEIRPIYNWHELLELWGVTTALQVMEGLLHVGFSVSLEKVSWDEPAYSYIDRLLFYFSVADGWADHYLLKVSGEADTRYELGWDRSGNFIKKSASELRQQLARKAFDQLCLYFFNKELHPEHEAGFSGIWPGTVASEQLLPVIMNFFRVEGSVIGRRIRNLSRRRDSHTERVATNFLMNLAEFIWEWKAVTARDQYLDVRTRLDEAKPWMIDILVNLGKLDFLNKWIADLDERCLGKLREIAMGCELGHYHFPVSESRPVATLDEACLVGSKAAWLLKKRELMDNEQARLQAICTAEQRLRDAKSEVARLSSQQK